MRFKSLILCLLLTISCAERVQENAELSSTAGGKVDPTAVKVSIATVKPLDYVINAIGKVVSFNSIELKSQSPGFVKRVYVKNGDRVKAGQLIALLDDEKEKIVFERAKINLSEYKIKFENEVISYGGFEGGKDIPEEVMDNLKVLSGLKKAELDFREAEINYNNTRIKAPFSGTLADWSVKRGEYIIAGSKLAIITDNKNLGVELNILEVDYPIVKTGYEALVNPVGRKSIRLNGVVENINTVVDEKKGMIKTLIRLKDGQDLVIPGMNVEVKLKIPGEPVIVVPRESVVVRSGREVLFTVENNLAKWNYIEVGNENGEEIEILDGIKAGSQVIISNNLQLSHDAAVSVESNTNER